MEDFYSVRVSRWSAETVYRLHTDSLHWSDERGERDLLHANIRKVRVYKIRYFRSRTSYWRCDLTYADGVHIRLQAAHYGLDGRVEDRTTAYIPFIKRLEARLAHANPNVAFETAEQRLALLDTAVGVLAIVALRLVRLVDLRHAANAAGFLMHQIGPWLKGHGVAKANLVAAFPEKSTAEIEGILNGMWDNLGRVFAEYAHLDRLWDFDPTHIEADQILIEGDDRTRFVAAIREKGPALVFSAHLANWELLPFALGSRLGENAVVYRPTRIPSIDCELTRIRSKAKVGLISANLEAFFAVKDVLRRGGMVGIVVDEHFPRGIDVMFFGRACKVTPIFAQLARKFKCPIYGARVVRLANAKFRLNLVGPLSAPRDATGKIDVAATMQMITGMIEGWIKENPEQWLWLQRRWR